MSDKERDLILFLNKKTDFLYHINEQVKVVVCGETNLSKENYNAYIAGYSSAIKDFKSILLNLLKGEVVYDEKESSETF